MLQIKFDLLDPDRREFQIFEQTQGSSKQFEKQGWLEGSY